MIIPVPLEQYFKGDFMAASVYDIIIEQGATYTITVLLKKPNKIPFNLTGYTGRSQIRKHYDDSNVIISFSVAIPSPQKDGKIVMSLTDEQTASLPIINGVYDLEIESSTGEVSRILQGKVTISPEVTRPTV